MKTYLNNERLTGKKRYRVENGWLFKGVVLQVEVQWDDGPDDWQGMPEYLRGIMWRDARPEDLQYLS